MTAEKKGMIEEAQKMITTIRQMEASLDDTKPRRKSEDDDLQITYPLSRCLQVLKEKHIQISRLHRDRYEQVKSMRAPGLLVAIALTRCRIGPSPRILLAPP